MALFKQMVATKSLETLHAEMEGEGRLRRALGPVGLSSIGVGAIIGAGIFVITGRAAALDAGPGILLSYLVAGFACALAALCYAEFAAMAPVAGSAYTYSYATLGEIFAWIIGWDLILEYAMSAAVVSAVWAKYLNSLLKVIGQAALGNPEALVIPEYLCNDPFSKTGAWLNLPAVLVMVFITGVIVVGIRESALTNSIFVAVKLGVVLFVIALGVGYINTANYTQIPVTERITAEEQMIPEAAAQIEKYEQDMFANADRWSKAVYGTDAKGQPERQAVQLILRKAGEAAATTLERPTEPFTERRDRLAKMAMAQYKIETAEATGDADLVAKAEAKYADDLPKSEREREIVTGLLKEVRENAPRKTEERWGLLAKLGINKQLEKVDDRVRSPFLPYGLSGVMLAAAIVFFAYIGFDAVSTHAEEARNPRRDVPIGILASLAVCTVLYVLVSAVITGMERYPDIDRDAAIAEAFRKQSQVSGNKLMGGAAGLIAIGGLAGMTSVLLITFQSQSRIFLAMARDGLLPRSVFAAVHPRFQTPHVSSMITGAFIALVAAFTPILKLEEMVNIGTLLAFSIVCGSVLVLRITRPEANRPFRTPLIWVLAPLGILANVTLMMFLPIDTWFRLLVWLGLGLVIYFGFGLWNSTLRKTLEARGA